MATSGAAGNASARSLPDAESSSKVKASRFGELGVASGGGGVAPTLDANLRGLEGKEPGGIASEAFGFAFSASRKRALAAACFSAADLPSLDDIAGKQGNARDYSLLVECTAQVGWELSMCIE